MSQGGLYYRYGRYLPGIDPKTALDLGQGGTPLVPSRAIGPSLGLSGLHFKLESLNPTGSYKDRFAGLAMAEVLGSGTGRCVATSSGNTGAALAAFAAAAGLPCALYVSENAPAGKLAQMLAYGADVYRVKGFTIDAAESQRIGAVLKEQSAARGLVIYITGYAICPGPMEGIKTISYEINDALGPVDDVFVPVGGGGLFVATSRGFADLVADGTLAASPRMHVVQPGGNDTIATPLREGRGEARGVTTSTRISGLGVAYVLDGDTVINHAQQTGGNGHLIDEDRIFEVQRRLAREEGILVEPAGAVSVAGAIAAAERGELDPDARTVCILTGHGFKDPAAMEAMGAQAQAITRDDIPATFAGAGSAQHGQSQNGHGKQGQ